MTCSFLCSHKRLCASSFWQSCPLSLQKHKKKKQQHFVEDSWGVSDEQHCDWADEEKASARTDQQNQQEIRGSRCHRAGQAACLQRELWPARHKLTVIAWRSRRREKSALFNTFPSSPFHSPPPLPPPDICVSGCRTLNSSVFSVSFSTQRVHVWVMATGWPDTQWQTGPWADRTNAITPHSAHNAAAQNTAISYLSRQLCLRRRIGKQRELAFYHTNTSLGTEGGDKHVTDLTGI